MRINLFGDLFMHDLVKMHAEIVMSAVHCNYTIFAGSKSKRQSR